MFLLDRRWYTAFKLEAVRLIRDLGVSDAQASQGPERTSDAATQLGEDPQEAFPGQGPIKLEQLEIAWLKREVIKLKAERDILKKAAAYFAKEST